MGINLEYGSETEIPQNINVKDLYSEKDGKFVFTGIEGIKTQSDIDNLQEALRKERNDHGALKERLKMFDGIDAEAARKAIEENEILKLNANKTTEEVQAHIQSKLTAGLAERDATIAELKALVEGFESEKKLANHTKLVTELAGKDIADDMMSLVTTNLMTLSEVDMAGELVTTGSGGYEKGLPLSKVIKDMLANNPRLAKQNTKGHGDGNNNIKSPKPKTKNTIADNVNEAWGIK